MKINQDILLPQSDQERAFEIKDASVAATVELIASGLDSSGGWTFSSEGALYVTEAGGGGDGASIPSSSLPDERLLYGETGAITRIQDGEQERIYITTDGDRVTITNGTHLSNRLNNRLGYCDLHFRPRIQSRERSGCSDWKSNRYFL